MRGADITLEELFSVRTLGERTPRDHPLRKLRAVFDLLLRTMHADFGALYAKTGRESIRPERLLRASLLQVLCSVRSERQLVEYIEFNLLYRRFVGLTLDTAVWDRSTFSANRDRLLNTHMSRLLFDRVLLLAEWQQLLSDEHFSVDGTPIKAWASMKHFVRNDGTSPLPEDGGRDPTVNFKGETRRNGTHASTSDQDARLYRKNGGDKAQFCFIGHALIENRQGLVVDLPRLCCVVQLTLSNGMPRGSPLWPTQPTTKLIIGHSRAKEESVCVTATPHSDKLKAPVFLASACRTAPRLRS